jgi:hypothetical protein
MVRRLRVIVDLELQRIRPSRGDAQQMLAKGVTKRKQKRRNLIAIRV